MLRSAGSALGVGRAAEGARGARSALARLERGVTLAVHTSRAALEKSALAVGKFGWSYRFIRESFEVGALSKLRALTVRSAGRSNAFEFSG